PEAEARYAAGAAGLTARVARLKKAKVVGVGWRVVLLVLIRHLVEGLAPAVALRGNGLADVERGADRVFDAGRRVHQVQVGLVGVEACLVAGGCLAIGVERNERNLDRASLARDQLLIA